MVLAGLSSPFVGAEPEAELEPFAAAAVGAGAGAGVALALVAEEAGLAAFDAGFAAAFECGPVETGHQHEQEYDMNFRHTCSSHGCYMLFG
jgi:hypothetical protein